MAEALAVDVHTHLAPRLSDVDAAQVGITIEDGRYVVGRGAVGPGDLYDPAALVGYLDRCQVDVGVVSIPPPFFRQGLDAEASAAWVRVANEGLLKALDGNTRFRALAYLPLEHPAAAVAEYERIRTDERWAGVCGAAGGHSRALDDAELKALWQLLDEDARTFLLHPAASSDPRLTRYYLGNLLGNPGETGVAAAELVFGGLLANWHAVRVVLVHCGGVLPALVGRWQRGVDTDRPGLETLELSPVAAVRRLYVDTLAHDGRVVDLAAEVFGHDKLLLGSDWPFPMGAPDVRAQVGHLDEAAVRKIAEDNAAAALGW